MTATKVSYYPGCSLHGTAREYDMSVRAVCRALNVTLEELPDWNCCGASSAHRTSEQLAIELPARNLAIAARLGRDVMVPCAACYNRLKAAQHEQGSNSVAVLSLLDLLAQRDMLGQIQQKLVHPLNGLPVVAYYGCLLSRPPKVTGAAAPFNPMAMDDLLLSAGAEVRRWSNKTTCCGASFTLAETGIVEKLCSQLRDAAIEARAAAFVTACPMCAANLDTRQTGEPKLPVFYVSELLCLTLGLDEVNDCWRGHRIDPRPLLSQYGIDAK